MNGYSICFFFFQAEDGIRDSSVTGVQTCALPISKSAHRHGVPGVDAAGISRECREHGETGEKMRMPGKRVIAQRARRLGQNHRESDESEGLPKLRRFEPDEKNKETAARGGEEAANRALRGIVTQGGQPGGEIERCTEDGKSKQPQAYVSVFWGFEVQIDDDAAIDGECAK